MLFISFLVSKKRIMNMKILTLALAVAFTFSAPVTLAQSSAGNVFGAGVPCTFNDGAVKHLPRELCKAYGGKHQ
jgi:hypothetical protein